MKAFNDIGLKVARVGIVFVVSPETSVGLQIVYKDANKIPNKAQRFAQALIDAGFNVTGSVMDTLGDDQFIFIVGRQ